LNQVNVQPRARAEAEQAAAWYEAQRPGLGIDPQLTKADTQAALHYAADTLAHQEIVAQSTGT